MRSNIRLALELDGAQSPFTNGDTLRGRVVVQADEDAEVDEITVRYLVRADTLATEQSSNDDQYSKYSNIVRQQELIHESRVEVFGFAEQKILNAGEHSFDYSFKIPNSLLPPSFLEDARHNGVTHQVRVDVKHPAWYSQHPHLAKNFSFVPKPDPRTRFPSATINIPEASEGEHPSGVKTLMQISFPQAIAIQSRFPLAIKLTSPLGQPIRLSRFSITAIGTVTASAQGTTERFTFKTHKLSDRLYSPRDLDSAEDSVCDVLDTVSVPNLTPSFSTEIVHLRWKLQFSGEVLNSALAEPQKFTAVAPVVIVPRMRVVQYPQSQQSSRENSEKPSRAHEASKPVSPLNSCPHPVI